VSFAYSPEIWRDFYEVVSLAAATLTGLLAVALSMNIRAVVASPARMGRAREALIALTVLLTVSIFVLIPQQGRLPLGIELIAVSLVVLVLSLRLQTKTTQRIPARHRRRWTIRAIGLNTATLAITLAGASLVAGRLGGLLWLIYTTLYCLIWSTYDAWSLTIRLPGTLEGERPTGSWRESPATPDVEGRRPARVEREMHEQLDPPRTRRRRSL
jgi:hypothetical protein